MAKGEKVNALLTHNIQPAIHLRDEQAWKQQVGQDTGTTVLISANL